MKLAVGTVLLAIPMLAISSESVFEAHDREPVNRQGDCDHKECKAVTQASVPEMGALEANALLVLGVGGVWFFTRRRKTS